MGVMKNENLVWLLTLLFMLLLLLLLMLLLLRRLLLLLLLSLFLTVPHHSEHEYLDNGIFLGANPVELIKLLLFTLPR